MFHSLSSQIYKMVKTPIFWLMFVWPVLFVALFISYYSVAAWGIEEKLSGYFQALSLVMPCLLALLCSYFGQKEQQAGQCFNLLCVGKSRIWTFFSLFILLSIMTGIGLVLASIGFCLFWGQMATTAYLLTTWLLLFPLAGLLLIQMFVAFRFGPSWSVGLGAIFLLLGALGITGLFDRWWYYLPPAWGPRFTSLMILDVFYPDRIITIAAELRHGLLSCLLFTVILTIVVPSWFHKWDGPASLLDE